MTLSPQRDKFVKRSGLFYRSHAHSSSIISLCIVLLSCLQARLNNLVFANDSRKFRQHFMWTLTGGYVQSLLALTTFCFPQNYRKIDRLFLYVLLINGSHVSDHMIVREETDCV